MIFCGSSSGSGGAAAGATVPSTIALGAAPCASALAPSAGVRSAFGGIDGDSRDARIREIGGSTAPFTALSSCFLRPWRGRRGGGCLGTGGTFRWHGVGARWFCGQRYFVALCRLGFRRSRLVRNGRLDCFAGGGFASRLLDRRLCWHLCSSKISLMARAF